VKYGNFTPPRPGKPNTFTVSLFLQGSHTRLAKAAKDGGILSVYIYSNA